MSLIGPWNILAGASGAGAYTIDQSLRFNDGSSGGKLTRTQGTPTGNKAFTYSFWFKGKSDMAGLNDNKDFGFLDASSTDNDFISMGRLNGKFSWALRGGTGDGGYLVTTEELRDPGAWYHMVITMNSAESTASDRMKIYKNGEQITALSTENYCAENYVLQNFNTSGVSLKIGQETGSYPGGAYMAEVHFIDGQQLTPSDFGETDLLTNQWKPIKYAGTYGDNGFFLEFKDSSSLGDDTSGNTNDFTVANLTTTSQVIDSPANTNGGNFCTLNQLDTNDNGSWNGVLQQGNLQMTGSAGVAKSRASFALDTTNGSYWEVRWGAATDCNCGISKLGQNNLTTSSQVGADPSYDETGYKGSTGVVDTDGSTEATYATSSEGTIVAFAYKAGRLYVGKVASAGSEATWFNSGDPAAGTGYVNSVVKPDPIYWAAAVGTSHTVNFGQDSSFAGNETAQANKDANGIGEFWGSVPTGFLGLCSDNLPDPSIALPGENFNTMIWSGDDASPRAMTGLGFAPDAIWIKQRNGTEQACIYDVVRGVYKFIAPSETTVQGTLTEAVQSFDSDGWTMGDDTANNGSGKTYVGWNWKGGGTGVSNTDGTNITSTVSANPTAGFSICKYTGTGTAGDSFGHGLSVAPDLVVVKRLETAAGWPVYNSYSGNTKRLEWDNDMAVANADAPWNLWNDTGPSATTVTLGDSTDCNNDDDDYVAYCFTTVEGYCKVGNYTGNYSANGPFIYTGFKPAYAWFKRLDDTQSWLIFDNARNTYNQMDKTLRIDTTQADQDIYYIDMVSNGIKIREGSSIFNHAGGSYLFIAFAESPFKTANAR